MRISRLLGAIFLAAASVIPRASAQDDRSLMIGGAVEVTFSDDFGGSRLSDDWTIWSEPPQVNAGQMILEGRRSWQTAVTRPDITVNEGVLQLFQYQTGTIELFLDYGDYSDPSYRNWHFTAYGGDTWQIYTSAGARGAQKATYQSAQLRPDTWYYLLLRLADRQRFYIQVWERDSLTDYVLNAEIIPAGDGWDGNSWWFGYKVFDGSLTVNAFQELRFAPDFAMPCSVSSSAVVNRRAGPGTENALAGQLNAYRTVRTIGQRGDWWKLADESWVRSDLVTENGACEDLPAL